MVTEEFSTFEKAVREQLSQKSGQKIAIEKSYKKVLGAQIFDLTDDPSEHSELVSAAIEIAGVKPGRVNVKEGYGDGLIHNYRSNGGGSFPVSLALHYYFLKCHDTPARRYSECVIALDLFVFGEERFERRVEWVPAKLPQVTSKDMAMSWTGFIREQALFQGIDIDIKQSCDNSSGGLPAVGFKSIEPVFDGEIALDEGFRFKLTLPIEGLGLALQTCEKRTLPMGFSHENLLFQTGGDEFIFPEHRPDSPYNYLYEEEIARRHQFIFIIVDHRLRRVLMEFAAKLPEDTEIPKEQLNSLADQLLSNAGTVMASRINVNFVSARKTKKDS